MLCSINSRWANLTINQQDSMKNRFTRMIDVEDTPPVVNSIGKLVNLKRGQVIHVEFIEQGDVLNERHFAIVWQAYKDCDTVVVIPTSKTGTSEYNIGIINNNNEKNTFVKVNQVQTVSRKSLTPYIKTTSSPNTKLVYLDVNQLNRVTDLYRFTHLKEIS